MNIFLASAFFVVAHSSTLSVSDSDSKDDVAANDGIRLTSSRSMLRKTAEVEKKKESYRDDSIPVFEGTVSFDQTSRVLAKDCSGAEKYFMLDLSTDNYGFENSWQLKKKQGNRWNEIESGPPGGTNYGSNGRFVGGYCLPPGDYKFIVHDLFKDGMCCSTGRGKYTAYLDGTKRFSSPSGNQNWEERVHEFSVSSALPFSPKNSLTSRDSDWLESHNRRRKSWHQGHGKTYIPLKWSNALKEESIKFAEKLLKKSCGDLYHDPNNRHGENLASNSGTGNWAEVRPTDSIVTRWVEDEVDDVWPGNGHLTQVLWRASKYVGCGEASKPRSGGGKCHAQVCRYARPGNCNMNKYKTNKKDWWLKPMLMDDSPCDPECPPDGC